MPSRKRSEGRRLPKTIHVRCGECKLSNSCGLTDCPDCGKKGPCERTKTGKGGFDYKAWRVGPTGGGFENGPIINVSGSTSCRHLVANKAAAKDQKKRK